MPGLIELRCERAMPVIIKLQGGSALSSFRLDKLVRQAADAGLPSVQVSASFWHFVEAESALSADEQATLDKLLTYGEPATPAVEGMVFVVLPRCGTVSPWSSKATDITRHCGLGMISRIERGLAYWVSSEQPLSDAERQQLSALLHDRMTESVLPDLAAADRLFAHYPPKPLNSVDVLGGGPGAGLL